MSVFLHRHGIVKKLSPLAGSYRYWRVRRTASSDPNFVGLAELKLGNFNPTKGTVLFSTTFGGSFLPQNVFDNNNSTIWATSGGSVTNAYIGYHFVKAQKVDFIRITSGSSPGQAAYCPTGFVVESSADGVTWVTEWVVNTSAWGISETRTFPRTPLVKSQWRVLRTASIHATYVGFAELDLGGNPATGGSVLKSTEFNNAGSAAANVFDGNPLSLWTTEAGAVTGAFVGYDFFAPATVDSVTITSSDNATRAQYCPTEFSVQSSVDGTTWVTEWTVTTPAWGVTETRTFNRP